MRRLKDKIDNGCRLKDVHGGEDCWRGNITAGQKKVGKIEDQNGKWKGDSKWEEDEGRKEWNIEVDCSKESNKYVNRKQKQGQCLKV